MNYAQAIVNLHPNNEFRASAPDGYTGNHVGAGRFDPEWGQTEYDNNITMTGPDAKQSWSAVEAEALFLYREAKRIAIQDRTDLLLEEATFEYGGLTFGLDGKSRDKWTGSMVLVTAGMMTYPRPVSDLLGDRVILNDDTEAAAFFGTGFATAAAVEESAYALIDAVKSATTKAELDAVIDSR